MKLLCLLILTTALAACHDSDLVGEWSAKCSKIWAQGMVCNGGWMDLKLGPNGEFEEAFFPPENTKIEGFTVRGRWSTHLFGHVVELKEGAVTTELAYKTWNVTYKNIRNTDGSLIKSIRTRELGMVILKSTVVDKLGIITTNAIDSKSVSEAENYLSEVQLSENRETPPPATESTGAYNIFSQQNNLVFAQ